MSARDVIARFLEEGGDARLTWEQEADALLAWLDDAGFRILGKPNRLDCYECGKPIAVGQAYQTHGRAGRVHQACL